VGPVVGVLVASDPQAAAIARANTSDTNTNNLLLTNQRNVIILAPLPNFKLAGFY
jgi:hypothetical protein